MSEHYCPCCAGPSKAFDLPGYTVDPATGITVPADITTSETIEVGGTYEGVLEQAGDHDWIALELDAGQTVEISVVASGSDPLEDPFLVFYDENGDQLDRDDDSAGGPNGTDASLIFTATEAGTYYIEAGSFRDRSDGEYTVSVVETEPPPPPSLLTALDWGGGTVDGSEDGIITVYFAPAGETLDGYTSEGFNAYEIAQFEASFELVSSVADVTFVVTDDADADLRLVLDTNEISDERFPFLGYFNPPGERGEGIGVFNGDSWDRESGGSLDVGGYDFVTITHEFLHALGMAHPHDNGGGSDLFEGVDDAFDDYGDFDLNQGVYTTMSYNTGFPGDTPGPRNEEWGYEAGPMALDIAVLQDKYGANTTTGTGNTVYALPDLNASGTYWLAIWDVDGVDAITYEGARDTTIDLRAATLQYEEGGGGFVSQADTIAGGYTIAAGVVIENAISGSGSDLLQGNAANNTLDGKQGADTLFGGDGEDRLIGGGGADHMEGGRGNDIYIVGAVDDVVVELEDQGTDTVQSSVTHTLVENIETLRLQGTEDLDGTGNADDNALVGQAGDNVLTGLEGFDILTAKDGDDVLIGGEDLDWLVGNEGADVFVYEDITDSLVGQDERDLINGFDHGADLIDLSAISDDVLVFIGTDDFDGAGTGQVNYASWESLGDWNIVSIDADGDGTMDMQIFVNQTDTMSASDFIL